MSLSTSNAVAPNAVRRLLAAGEVVLGTTLGLSSTDAIRAAARAGYVFAQIDLEHQHVEPQQVIDLIDAGLDEGLVTLVRVPDGSPTLLTRVLDWGATGVFVPHVQTKAQAEAIVEATKFGPWGHRNVGARVRSAAYRELGPAAFSSYANADTLVWVLIEDLEGVSNLDDILSVRGIDAVMPGPGDLSYQIGCPGNQHDPRVVELVEQIYATCLNHEVPFLGSQAWDPGGIKGAIARGARLIFSGSDRALLQRAYVDAYAEAAAAVAAARQ